MARTYTSQDSLGQIELILQLHILSIVGAFQNSGENIVDIYKIFYGTDFN